MKPVPFKKLKPNAIPPTRAHSKDSGADLYSISETHIIEPQECSLIETGLAFKIPPPEYWNINGSLVEIVWELQARSKSGLALKEMLGLGNGIGTIDNSYTGEVKGIFFNFGKRPKKVMYGQKIFQIVLCPIVIANYYEVDDFEDGERGANGYGSTGV